MNRITLPTTSGAYRWYYVDVTAGEYTAVFIFMLGSIFSARYSTALKAGGLPREHAAVNFALYHRGVRVSWVLSEYGDLTVSGDGSTLTIGNSHLRYHDGGLSARVVDRTTPFLVTGWGEPTEVELELTPRGPTGPELRLVDGMSHAWRPIAARADATVKVAPLDLTLSGPAYHDGNHGEQPLGSDLRGWAWTRTHRPRATAIEYRPWVDAPAWQLDIDEQRVELGRVHPAQDSVRTSWGLRVPRQLLPAGEPAMLESSPFYARLEQGHGDAHALGEVADFARFHRPTVRWMASFRTRRATGSAA